MGVTVQWLKFLLNKFRERFQIREIREIKDPRNISAIRYRDGIKRKGDKIGMVSMCGMSSNVKVVAT